MITPGELDLIQAAQEALFDQTVSVWRAERARSTTGGTTEVYVQQAEYPCRLAPAKAPAEMVIAGRLSGARTWWATFAHDADVRVGDELRAGDRVLKVVGVQAGASYQTALRALCEEVD